MLILKKILTFDIILFDELKDDLFYGIELMVDIIIELFDGVWRWYDYHYWVIWWWFMLIYIVLLSDIIHELLMNYGWLMWDDIKDKWYYLITYYTLY